MEKKHKTSSTKVLLDHINEVDKKKRNNLIIFFLLFLLMGGVGFWRLGPTYFPHLFEESKGHISHKHSPTDNPELTSSTTTKLQIAKEKAVSTENDDVSINDDLPSNDGTNESLVGKQRRDNSEKIEARMLETKRENISSKAKKEERAVDMSLEEENTDTRSIEAENNEKQSSEEEISEKQASSNETSKMPSFAKIEQNTSTIPSTKKDEVNIKEKEIAAPRIMAAKMPSFPGGEKAMFTYLNEQIEYPKQAQDFEVEGKVYVQFVVDTQGQIQTPKVVKGLGYGCDQEALRIVNLMPNWEPGQENGETVPVIYTLPISFQFQ